MHAHRDGWLYAWHNDAPRFDNAFSLKHLNLDHVLKNGYVNLRCRLLPGCPSRIQPFRDPPGNPSTPESIVEQHMPAAWEYMFPGVPVPHEIGVACCAQFAVSRAQIRARPLEDYERVFTWLMQTNIEDMYSGRISPFPRIFVIFILTVLVEYLWHILFGRAARQ